MGCTSSAPNITEVSEKSTDKGICILENDETNNLKKNEKITAVSDESEIKVVKVLPVCDNVDNNLKLHTNKDIELDILSSENDNEEATIDDTKNENVMDSTTNISDDLKTQDSIRTLKDVVEKVIVSNASQKKQNKEVKIIKEHNNIQQQESDESNNKNVKPKNSEEIEKNVFKDIEIEQAVSPSQSESSRATRWEALADIAAELPASHTIDPITGHIYALAK